LWKPTWDLMTGEELLRGSASVGALRFSPDGRHLAASPSNLEAGLYEVAPMEVLRELRPLTTTKTSPSAFARSSTGRFLLFTVEDRLVVWDTEAGEEIHSVIAAGGPSTRLFFGPGDQEIYCSRGKAGINRRAFGSKENPTTGRVNIILGPERSATPHADEYLSDVGLGGHMWLAWSPAGRAYLWPEGLRSRSKGPVALQDAQDTFRLMTFPRGPGTGPVGAPIDWRFWRGNE
jgi:hypothetical protein